MSKCTFTDQYKQDAAILLNFELSGSKTVGWESPSNIALIKYWGKSGDQIPQNPSISFNLNKSKTVTKVVYKKKENPESQLVYFFEDKHNIEFEKRVKRYFEKIAIYMPFISELDFEIYSHNSFPHSAGIASSASSFSALAHCLCTIEQSLFQTLSDNREFHQKASFLARLGSGSASRSIPGETILWGKTGLITESSDEIAVNIAQVHDVFKSYYDAILVIDSGQKSLSSSEGHALMQNHPFAKSRYKQANVNLEKLLLALKSGAESLFAQIVENEAMTLHALLLSSNPSVPLIKPNTLMVIDQLIEFRKKHRLDFTFTLDAGPNIHILYPSKIRKEIIHFIKNRLADYCENGLWIDDKISAGPKQVNY